MIPKPERYNIKIVHGRNQKKLVSQSLFGKESGHRQKRLAVRKDEEPFKFNQG